MMPEKKDGAPVKECRTIICYYINSIVSIGTDIHSIVSPPEKAVLCTQLCLFADNRNVVKT